MKRSCQLGIRLDGEVASAYQQLADAKGVKLSTYLKEVLTNNLHTVSIKSEVDRFEGIVHDMQANMLKAMSDFTNENKISEKYYEDFGSIYMMLLGTLMQLKVDKEDIKRMQNKGTEYGQSHFLESRK